MAIASAAMACVFGAMPDFASAQPTTAAATGATTAPAARKTALTAAQQLRATALIDALGDRSSKIRDDAALQLVRMGRVVRPLLVEASASPSAQRRQLAKSILSRLPLFATDDPVEVRDALRAYQRLAPAGRPNNAAALLLRRSPSFDVAVARILMEETDDAVVWSIIGTTSTIDHQRLARGPLANADQDPSEPLSPPVRYLLASTTRVLATRLEQFQRCLDELSVVPPPAVPAVARIANTLCAKAKLDGDGPREIAIRRRVALMMPGEPAFRSVIGENDPAEFAAAANRLSPAVEQYLVARVRLRSADGIEGDLEAMGVPDNLPIVRLMLTLLAGKGPTPTTAPVDKVDVSPEVLAIFDGLQAEALPDVLTLLGSGGGEWPLVDAISSRELAKLTDVHDAAADFRRVRLGLVRYSLARARNNTAAAAEALRIALATAPEGNVFTRQQADGTVMAVSAGDLFAEIYIADARRAMRADDPAALNAALDALARVSLSSSSLVLDAVYLLELHGRVVEADEIFSEQLATQRDELAANPDSITAINSVAWLCARTGRDLERAYTLAARANELSPGSAGLMDTQAEAAFRTNRVAEAIKLEEQAIALDRSEGGGDAPFMARQLARFRAGLQPGDAERALPSESWVEE